MAAASTTSPAPFVLVSPALFSRLASTARELQKAGFLTRDSRAVERKYGLKKALKAPAVLEALGSTSSALIPGSPLAAVPILRVASLPPSAPSSLAVLYVVFENRTTRHLGKRGARLSNRQRTRGGRGGMMTRVERAIHHSAHRQLVESFLTTKPAPETRSEKRSTSNRRL